MDSRGQWHPSDQELRKFSNGRLDDGRSESINNHLLECPACQRRVSEMSSDSFLGRLRKINGRPQVSDPAQGESGASGTASRQGAPAGTLAPALLDHPDYEIVRELGRGGMGVVYLAHNKLMGRDEVLKVVSKHLIERKGVLDRFAREIRAAARLSHPNIVSAYSASRYGESVVFAMEYVNGLDLAKLVKANGALPVAHACTFTYQAALGLLHAHEQGMVHRDIKPGNLMLAKKGDKPVIKVLDFGLAKATLESPIDGGLTHEGQMLGTPDFIAPEQIRDAQSAGIQTDIYSLGCTLYYLLTGAPPFEAASLYDLFQAHFSMDAQPLNLLRPEVPVELAALVAKMMAKEPRRRFQTPGEVAEALKPFFKRAAQTAKPEVSAIEPSSSSLEYVRTIPAAPEDPTNSMPALAKVTGLASLSSAPSEQRSGESAPATSTERASETLPATGSGRRLPRKPVLIGAAGAIAVGMLGVIIIIVSRDARVTIRTERGKTDITVSSTDRDETHASPATRRVGAAHDDKPATPVFPGALANSERPAEVIAPSTGSSAERTPAAVPEKPPAEKPREDVVRRPPAPPGHFQAYTNSIGMKLVLFNEGSFQMGSPDGDELAGADQKPQHPVRISRPFYLGVFEITQAWYEAIIGDNPSNFSAKGGAQAQVVKQDTRDFPVECVSWIDAIMFCNALSKKDGLKPFYELDVGAARVPDWNGPGYRLPTEAEWEYSARAGSQSAYSFGNDPAELNDHGWYRNNSDAQTHRVGLKKPNAFGLFDMHGNVREWCWDVYGPYGGAEPVTDPRGPSGTGNKVLRGRSWGLPREFARSAAREQHTAGKRNRGLGFRVALNPSGKIKPVSVSTADLLLPSESKVEVGLGGSKLAGPLSRTAEPAITTIAAAAAPVPVPGSPEAKLASRGLTQSGTFFVVASENEFLEKARNARPVWDQVAKAFAEYGQALRNAELMSNAEGIRAELSAQIDGARAMLSKMPNGRLANSADKQDFQLAEETLGRLERERDAAVQAIDKLRGQQVPEARMQELANAFATKRSEFMKSADELRVIREKAMGEYRKLQNDVAVKDALVAYGRSMKTSVFLGPSPSLPRVFEKIKEAVRVYSPESAVPKKKPQKAKRQVGARSSSG
jgi:serine/threonine protein kinase/formylglycine-generating enzyme required for sulfatase activity